MDSFRSWGDFEISDIRKKGRLWTYLLDLTNSDVKGPLWQFQHTTANEADTLALLHAINKVSEKPLPDAVLKNLFEKFWPDLQAKLIGIAKEKVPSKIEKRSNEEMIEEVLELVRGLVREKASVATQRPDLSELQRLLSSKDPNQNIQSYLWVASGPTGNTGPTGPLSNITDAVMTTRCPKCQTLIKTPMSETSSICTNCGWKGQV